MVEVVVIGGGAAGIAAARKLHDAGREVLLIEAKDRLGGRANSVALADMIAGAGACPDWVSALAGRGSVDAGCGWLHSARRNPWTAIAEATGFTIDRSSPAWREQWRDLGFPPSDQQAFAAAWERWETAARAALDGPDRPLSAFVAADDPWRPMLDAISGYANGAPLADVSLHDWAAYEDAATEDNWALPAGYGTLVEGHAHGVPHRLAIAVERIDHRGRRLRIETRHGAIEADAAIVCVPTATLGAIAFDPPLPAKHAAAAALPLGLADKVFVAVDRPDGRRTRISSATRTVPAPPATGCRPSAGRSSKASSAAIARKRWRIGTPPAPSPSTSWSRCWAATGAAASTRSSRPAGGTSRSSMAAIRTHWSAAAPSARRWLCRSTIGCFLPARRARRPISRPRTAPIGPGSTPPVPCWRCIARGRR